MRALSLLLALLLALAAELAALLLLVVLDGPLRARELVALGGLHLFAAVAAAEALRSSPGVDEQRDGAWRLGLALALLLPGFGLLLCAVLAVRTPRPPRAAASLTPMEDRRRQAEAELAAEAQQGQADVNVEAIGDALKDTDKAKRLGAVEALRALPGKQAVALLSRSLRNTVFEVRYHAVEALTGIAKKHSERIAAASAAAERDATPQAFRSLGECYLEYAALEMEDPAIQQQLLRSAVSNLLRGVQPGQTVEVEVQEKIGLALEMLGELEAAQQRYLSVLEQRPESFEALLGLARIQYRRGEFSELRETCRKALQVRGLDAQVRPVLQLWAEGPAAAEGV